MSLELVKETVKVNQIIGEDRTRTVLDNDIIVPDSKPDIARILLLDGDVYMENVDASQDKVHLNGSVRYKILYVSDDPEQPVKSIITNSGFQYSLNIPEARHGMLARAKCEIEHIDFEVVNSRKVNVKAILDVSGKVFNQLDQSVATDFEGTEGIQILKSTREVSSYLGCSEAKLPVKELMETPAGKPAIRDILRNDIKITGKECKLSEGKIVAKGDINISTLYIGDDETGSIQNIENEIPFTQFLDLNGIDETSYCNLDYNILASDFQAEEDNDGELRVLKGEITLGITAEGYRKKEIEIIEDAYNPGYRLSLEKEPIRMEELAAESKSQFVLKDTIFIENDSPEIAEVFNIICKPVLSDCIIENDRAEVEGVVSCSILYTAGDLEQPVICSGQELPFKQQVNISGLRTEMECDLELETENCSYSMVSSREVEVRLSIGITARAIKQVTVDTVTRAIEGPIDDKRGGSQPSLTIYFAQPGDTLWKVAKKYYVTTEEVRKLNNLPDSGEVNVGLQIIVPRKL